MSDEKLQAIRNRTEGMSAWFVDGFKASDAVAQFAPEFEILIAEIDRLRALIAEVQTEGIDGNGLEDWHACPWCKSAEWREDRRTVTHGPECLAFTADGAVR